MRVELTATEYAEHMQRRKEVWEAMRERESSGTTCSTTDRTSKRGRDGEGRPQEFAEATAKATGKSKQDTNRATKRAREVCQEARNIIRGTKADTGTFLDQLSRMDGDEQVQAAQEKVEAMPDNVQGFADRFHRNPENLSGYRLEVIVRPLGYTQGGAVVFATSMTSAARCRPPPAAN